MPKILEYLNEDGDIIRIEVESNSRPSRGSRDDSNETKTMPKKFEQALGTVKAAAKGLRKVVDDVKPDEFSVEFSLKAEGETGFFTIVKASTSAEFKITLTWKNEQPKV